MRKDYESGWTKDPEIRLEHYYQTPDSVLKTKMGLKIVSTELASSLLSPLESREIRGFLNR